MQLEWVNAWNPSEFNEVVVVAIPSQWEKHAHLEQLNQQTQGWLGAILTAEEVSTKPIKTSVHFSPPGLANTILITVGLGEAESVDPTIAFRAAGAGAKLAAAKPRKRVTFLGFPQSASLMEPAVIGAMNGFVGQGLFKSEAPMHTPDTVRWIGGDRELLEQASVVGESILFARRLINLPANHLDPEAFVDETRRAIDGLGIQIEVWDRDRLEAEKCGSLLAVARGSAKSPRLLILKYPGAHELPNEQKSPNQPGSTSQPIALVGKGVTFDSGGLSLKPSDSMLTMKCDMSGGATVVGIMLAAARLKLSQPLIGLVGLVENMIDADCFRLGDVLTARSGKTIEIHNTDAEGRLVLADVLNVSLDYKPQRIIDFATLTGACVVALGTEISGLMSNDPNLSESLQDAAKRSGEFVWPMPMHSFFTEQIAGKVADIKNMGEGRWGGAITAAKFLEEFVDGTPWAHFDIAGPAFYDNPKSWQDAGGTGTLIRTMIEWLRREKT